MSLEAKVGAFTAGGLGLLTAVVLYLSGFSLGGDKGYTVYIGYPQVIGLVPQSSVCLSGVPIGSVQSVEAEGGGVTVTVTIQPQVKVPRDSVFTIAASGVMGEKFVNILPRNTSSDLLQDGDYVYGTEEQGMDTMFAGMSKAIVQVQELLDSLNSIVGDPRLKDSVVQMSINMRDASAHVSGIMDAMELMVRENQGSVKEITRNLATMTAGLSHTADTVDKMLTDFSGDGKTAANLKAAVDNLASTSARIEKMASTLEGVVTDPQTAADLKATLHNARELTDRANKMVGKVSSIQVTPSAELMYNGKRDNYRANFNVDVTTEDQASLILGMEDIGDGNKVNAQVGKRKGSLGARAGVITGKMGVGLDAYAGDKWKFSLDTYDLNNAKVRLRSQYEMKEDMYLLGEIQDMADREDRRAYVGVKYSF
ncbi:MAG: MCE family protein [Selenomonadaceae bacterium]|nr:MCE family protein [Selenomonadaceae bacterium]